MELGSFVKVCRDSKVLACLWALQSCITFRQLHENKHSIFFTDLRDKPVRVFAHGDNLSHNRYSIKVTVAQSITIQVRTSKPDTFIKLQVLESEEIIVSTVGKGQAIIPAFYFHGNEKALSSQCESLSEV